MQEQPNFFNPAHFYAVIKRLPNTRFTLTKTTIGGASIEPAIYNNPLVKIPLTGDHISFEELDFNFIIDENLKNYNEIYTWLYDSGFPEDNSQYRNLAAGPKEQGLGVYSDINIMIQNSYRKTIKVAEYVQCFPIYLSKIILETDVNDIKYFTANAKFAYTLMRLKDEN